MHQYLNNGHVVVLRADNIFPTPIHYNNQPGLLDLRQVGSWTHDSKSIS